MNKNTTYYEEKIRIDFYFIKAKHLINSPNVSMLKVVALGSLLSHRGSRENSFYQ